MKAFRIAPLLLSLALVIPAAMQAQEAEVKSIAKAYSVADAQLKDMSHFAWIAEDVTEEFTHHYQLWRNLEGHAVKVTDDLERISSRDLTEYFFEKDKLAFVFFRSQQNEDGAGTTVTESRCYIVNGKVIQKMLKSAKFKEGAKLDMTTAKQVKAEPEEDDQPASWEARARKISQALQAGPGIEEDTAPEGDPPAPEPTLPEGPAAKFCTIIEESTSPNGKYALAWGLTDADKGPHASAGDAEQDTEGVVNYIVDIKADRILAVTQGKHFGANASYNHWEHHAVWSEDSALLIQTLDTKWSTLSAQAFRIENGTAAPLTDLLQDVRQAVEGKIAKTQAKAWKEQEERCTFTISALKLSTGGLLTLTAYHQIPKEDGGFTSKVKGKLSADGKFEASQVEVQKD